MPRGRRRTLTGQRERRSNALRRAAHRQQRQVQQPENQQHETQEQQQQQYFEQLARIPIPVNIEQQHQEPQAAQADIQEQPINPPVVLNEHQHYIGLMNQECDKCHAKYFPKEKTSRNKYTKCCQDGKVSLPAIAPPSQEIIDLFSGNSNNSANFKNNIRTYNSALAMASWNANLDTHPGRGPKVITIHGQPYHLTGPAEPEQGQERQFAQLYIIDTNQALAERMANPHNQELNPVVLRTLLHELNALNRYAQSYKHMGDVLREERQRSVDANEVMHPVRMIIASRPQQDRRYDNPTTTEVAAVYVGEEAAPPIPSQRDIAIYPTGERRTQHINAISEHADPMTYPLLFFNGEFGWSTDLPLSTALQQLRDGHANNNASRHRQRITLSQFYAYRISIREPFSAIHHGALLFQQYLVDAFTKIEGQDLNYIKTHQAQLRADSYQGLMDHVRARAEAENHSVGRILILPSSFQGSQRNIHQNFQDAMTIVRTHGKPDYFLTMTTNPKWREITEQLLQHQTANDRPDIVSRVFYIKFNELQDDLLKRHVLGRVIAYVYTVEFQKRGLPHAHMLLFLADQDKPRTAQDVDAFISAEIPDPDQQPELYAKVKKHMIHGPCGNLNPHCVCMKDNKCTKKFPKPINQDTVFEVNGYPLYRRRAQFTATVGGHTVDDAFVVPYNAYILQKYDCHSNVKSCTSIRSVKYLFKYIHKGYDSAHLEIREGVINHDEILEYLNARYVGPHQAVFRIVHYKLHDLSHTIIRLAVHLPMQQQIYFHEGREDRVLDVNPDTTLTAWFHLNSIDEAAHQYLYHDIPQHYTFNKQSKTWNKRRQEHKVIGRMYQVQPSDPQRFALRLLLLHVPGATSFEALRTIDDQVCPTFRDAARALGLLEDDRELISCLQEASLLQMPNQMRLLFATLLVFNTPSNPRQLFEDFSESMSEDYLYAERQRMHLQDLPLSEVQIHQCLYDIDKNLRVHGKSLSDFTEMPQLPAGYHPPHDEQPAINIEEERRQGEQLHQQLNHDQLQIVDAVVDAITTHSNQRCFFLDGSGGTGKTFLYNTLTHIMQGMQYKVKCLAYSGIASTLLINGATAHSTFQIPIPLLPNSTCNISRQSKRAHDLKATDLFIWDEASMIPADALKTVDILLRDLTECDLPFGGKFIFLGGDFRQILPVKKRAGREQIVNICLKRSPLWQHFHAFHLLTNMRAANDPEYQQFADLLLRIGNGTEPMDEQDRIQIPERTSLPNNSLDELVGFVFPQGPTADPQYMAARCCLTPKNTDSHVINDLVLHKLQGDTRTYLSMDNVVTEDEQEAAAYPLEFLNSLTPSEMPLHKLDLKIGTTIILLRNLSQKKGLCNGTRLIVRELKDHLIVAEIIASSFAGQLVLIPRITLQPQDLGLPFQLSRRQFPVLLAYCLTINKAQGQSLQNVGIYLPQDVFSHGQLYVAFSRATSFAGIKVVTQDGKYTKNVVYPEVLQ